MLLSSVKHLFRTGPSLPWQTVKQPEAISVNGGIGSKKMIGFLRACPEKLYIIMWRFPEMGVPPNHPFIDGIFHEINHPAIKEYHHFRKPPLVETMVCLMAGQVERTNESNGGNEIWLVVDLPL